MSRLCVRGRRLFFIGGGMSSPEWTRRGKSVKELIAELQTFENQELEVRISIDSGDTSVPISLVGKSEEKYALLMNFEDVPKPLRHR
jgi:hypothetical protein